MQSVLPLLTAPSQIIPFLSATPLSLHHQLSTASCLLEKGTNLKFGARPLRRTIQNILEDRLAEEILDGNIKKNKTNKIGVKDEKIVVEK